MAGIEICKNDVIATKDGRELRVLSVYKPAGEILRVDCIDDRSANPMRTPVFSKDIARILVKYQPKPTVTEKLPPEQAVKEKEAIPQELKKDVDSRKKNKVASAKKGGK